MPQPDNFQDDHKGHTIKADLKSVTIYKDGQTVYSRSLPDGQQVCTMTNFQCGRVWVDGR